MSKQPFSKLFRHGNCVDLKYATRAPKSLENNNNKYTHIYIYIYSFYMTTLLKLTDVLCHTVTLLSL